MMMLMQRLPFLLLLLLILILSGNDIIVFAGTPSEPLYFTKQIVNHLRNSNHKVQYWTQRYYQSTKYYGGSGYPIFVILGGEGSIEPTTGLLYPYITNVLAKTFNAAVIQPEHRFYGTSWPINRTDIDYAIQRNLPDPRISLLTYEQAIHDALTLVQHIAIEEFHCSNNFNNNKDQTVSNNDDNNNNSNNDYCPIITVGGSYPGFLSAMARIMFPFIVDISYAASAPMKFYSQQTSNTAYYDHISSVANTAVPGCMKAVKHTLLHIQHYYYHNYHSTGYYNTSLIGVCPNTVPYYASNNVTIFIQEVMMMIGYTFANNNMAYYPPLSSKSNSTSKLVQSCNIFMEKEETTKYKNKSNNNNEEKMNDNNNISIETAAAFKRLSKFFITNLGDSCSASSSCNGNGCNINCGCFNMSKQLPTGINASISGGDWSGVGTGDSGDSWDFQTCTLLIEQIGFGPHSMFPIRPWTLNWLQRHCSNRFGPYVVPQPYNLNEKWNINNIPSINTSRIIFTNGLNDGWSVSGIQSNISETIIAINFPNGAHHSDLNGIGPTEYDTEDIKQGHIQISEILSQWLSELTTNNETKNEHQNNFLVSQI